MRPLIKLSDADLVSAFNEGNPNAFQECYERYWLQLYKHALRMLRDEDQAADAVQEVYTKLLEKKGELWINGRISSYLFQAVRNYVIHQYNHGKVKDYYVDNFLAYAEEFSLHTEETIVAKDLERLFHRELNLLPPKMKEVFSLSRNENLSYKQIAEKTNISEGTVKKQIYNALKILKTKLTILIMLFFG